jgi:predicted AAA+ superfamily ATPase
MIERHLAPAVEEALGDTPVVMLTGPRQSGKSTLVQALAAKLGDARYLTLDDGLTLAAARNDPAGFVAGDTRTLVIDEVQRAPDLLPAIKASVDRDRRPGRYVLTGSANVLALPRIAEALAGRMEVLRLWPFSQGELEGRREGFLDALLGGDPTRCAPAASRVAEGADLTDRIVAGGFPEAVARSGARRSRWFDSYLDTVLQREVRDIANVTGLVELPRLMMLLAARATGLVNFAGISRDLGIPQTTLKRYVALFEAVFLIRTTLAWFRNIGKRMVKSPKLVLTDTGLLAHLLGGAGSIENARGALLENFVLMELVKQADISHERPAVLHFRTTAGSEVDAVVEARGGRIGGVEVKAASTVTSRDIRGLQSLSEALGDDFAAGVVLHTGQETVRLAPQIWAMPVAALWT